MFQIFKEKFQFSRLKTKGSPLEVVGSSDMRTEGMEHLDDTMIETEEELKLSLMEFTQEETKRKLVRCKECNRQRFNHPGGVQNYGEGKCHGLRKLELGSPELEADDLRVAKERETKRGVKRANPSADVDNENKRRKQSENSLEQKEGGSQEMMMRLMMQMNEMMQKEKSHQIELQRIDEERRKGEAEEKQKEREERFREKELELKLKEMEMKKQEELLRNLSSFNRPTDREDFKIGAPPT